MLLITHDGAHHADDVLAYVILSRTFPGATLVRTRDQSLIEGADDAVVFDVGAAFDPAARRYDHHMRDQPLREDGVPYSSVGLVWKYHGPEFLARRYPEARDGGVLARLWQRIDSQLICPVDMADNGRGPSVPDGFAAMIDAFNPRWDEDAEAGDRHFHEAAEFASRAFLRIADKAMAAEKAPPLVEEAARTAEDPRIVVLPRSMPWERTLTGEGHEEALYVVYPRTDGTWYCQAVPPERGSFEQRLPLPDGWAGLRDGELANASGVADAVFCHPGRFICGARSLDGALSLARGSIRLGLDRGIPMP